LLGIGQLTNAFGLLCFLRGISAIAGPPIAGSIFDYTQSYDISFYLGGTFLIVSSIVGFMVPAVRRLTARLKKRAEENKSSEMKELKSDDGCSPSKGSTKPVKVWRTAATTITTTKKKKKKKKKKEIQNKQANKQMQQPITTINNLHLLRL